MVKCREWHAIACKRRGFDSCLEPVFFFGGVVVVVLSSSSDCTFFFWRSSKVLTFNLNKNTELYQYKNISLPPYCVLR